MLLVRTYLEKSKIHGIGLFAKNFIPKGEIVWIYKPGFDALLNESEVEALPEVPKENIKAGSVLFWKQYFIYGDNAKFINHSETPNLLDIIGEDKIIAIQDIQSGEELTQDYRDFQEGANLDDRGLPGISKFSSPSASGN